MKKPKILFVLLFFLLIGAVQINAQVKIHGLTFGDFFYNASSFNPQNKDVNGVDIRRVYFTGDFTLSDQFSSRFRLETDQIGSGGGKNEFGVMVKDAWLKWNNIFSGSALIFGISPTPAFDVSEGAWGHRYLEKTIMDLDHIVGSRDMGIDLKGNLAENGSVKYWLKLGNNSGNSPEANKYKRYYGMLEFNPSKELLITLYGDYASMPQKAGKSNSAFVGAGFINLKQKGKFSIGVEGFLKSQQNNYVSSTGSLESQTGFGLSVWAYANISDKAQLVGRFDTFDPNTNSSANKDGKNLILAGIQFNPIPNVSVTPNIEMFTYQADKLPGGDKSDIIPRVSFYWVFP